MEKVETTNMMDNYRSSIKRILKDYVEILKIKKKSDNKKSIPQTQRSPEESIWIKF